MGKFLRWRRSHRTKKAEQKINQSMLRSWEYEVVLSLFDLIDSINSLDKAKLNEEQRQLLESIGSDRDELKNLLFFHLVI